MASNIARSLAEPENRRKTMIVLAGGNHIRYGFGIPRRVFRRAPLPFITIGGKEVIKEGEKLDRLMDVDMPTFPLTPYDFTHYIPYEDFNRRGVRLGVYLDTSKEQISIKKIMEGGIAATVDLAVGDILEEINGITIREMLDLTWELRQINPGEQVQLNIDRMGEKMEIDIHFPEITKETKSTEKS